MGKKWEVIRAAGHVGAKKMTEICNRVVGEGKIPKHAFAYVQEKR